MDGILTINSRQVLDETVRLRELHISPEAVLAAPEGKFISLCVNGTGRQILPGTYIGDIVLSVAESYRMPPHGLMKNMNDMENFGFKDTNFKNAVVVENGRLSAGKCVPALVTGGEIRDDAMCGGYIASNEDSFNAALITGNSRYEINGLRVDFDGLGANDFMGVGAAVTAIDNSHVTVNNCQFHVNGVTRCAVHAGGDSVVTVNNSHISNHSPDASEWLGDFSWGIGITGTNRLVQACDNATVYYNNCDMDTNGWGVFSIDGSDDSVKIYVKDSRVNLSGPRAHGYGIFCIGTRSFTSLDHSKVHVNGYPLLVMGMMGLAKAEIKNGCEITGNEYGVLVVGDNNTDVNISDSDFITGKSTFVVKGSATELNVEGCRLKPGNGVVLQLMDNDETGMDAEAVILPVGRKDVYIEGRELSATSPEQDVIMNLSNMDVEGDFYNSTTDFHLEKTCVRGESPVTKPTFGGLYLTPVREDGSAQPEQGPEAIAWLEHDAELRGPKNLELNLKNVRLEGVVSSARAEYRQGLTQITESTRLELSNITQSAAPTVNNGVIVSIDSESTWIVTGTSYITGLRIEPGALIKAKSGFVLRISVNGTQVPIQPGDYMGKIVLELVAV